MSDLSDRVRQQWSGLQQLASKIPGFSGYMQRESRRDADKLLRETLARRFEEQWRRLPDVQRQLMAAGLIDLVDDLESAVMKLQGIIDQLRTASYGFSGFFDAIKVNEPELDRIYAYDNQLADNAGRVQAAIDSLGAAISSKEGVAAAISNLNTICRETTDALARRRDVLVGTL